ncbi:MAG: hypothetical protein JJU33_06480 [Phycisphaerales bacterium]|nr:hypothetical protein [Phycisphaerales bacterium]
MRTTPPIFCFAATALIACSAAASPAPYEVIGFDGFGPWRDGSPVLRADGSVALGGNNSLRLWQPGGSETTLWSQSDPIHGLAPGRSVGRISFSSIDENGNGAVVGEIRTGGPAGAFSSMFYGSLIDGALHTQAGGEGDIVSGLVLPEQFATPDPPFLTAIGRTAGGTHAARMLADRNPAFTAFGPGFDARMYSIPGAPTPGGEGVFFDRIWSWTPVPYPNRAGRFAVGADGGVAYISQFGSEGQHLAEVGLFVDDAHGHRMLASSKVPASNGMVLNGGTNSLRMNSVGEVAYFGLMYDIDLQWGQSGIWIFGAGGVEHRAQTELYNIPAFGGEPGYASPGISMWGVPSAVFTDHGDIAVDGLLGYRERSRRAALHIGAGGERTAFLTEQWLEDPGAEFDMLIEFEMAFADDARSVAARTEVRYEGEANRVPALVYAGMDGRPHVLARRGDLLDVGGGIEYAIWSLFPIGVVTDQYVLADVMVNADGSFQSTLVMFTVPAPPTACLLLLLLGGSRRRRA